MHTFRFLPIVAVLALSACKSADRGNGNRASDGDYVSGTALGTPLPERQEGVSFMGNNVDRGQFPPVYFGFDSSTLPGSERAKLEQVASYARENDVTIIIAGFTDERGTPEYNRGLGERRALTVREEIIRLGGNGRRLQTVSFGEEMPADTGSGESAWAKNRRAEFGVVR